MDKYYTASKSRSQGRDSWAVIFRHPARLDAAGRPGRRVRRGLGTADASEADRLVLQLNELLSSPALWESSGRQLVAGRLDPRVVDIFFDGIDPIRVDHGELRDALLPLPGAEDGYRSVLTLGTTGAGKTTVVRQFLGTDPDTERFPSTSTAKTTVADTELIFMPGADFSAVVTFVGRDEALDSLTECVSEAAMAVLRGAPQRDIRRRLLDHPNQRFRFSYILGRGASADDDEDEYDSVDAPEELGGRLDQTETDRLIDEAISALRSLVEEHAAVVRATIDEVGDERVLEELIEETLDEQLRSDERYHTIVDTLFDQVEKRFDLLTTGDLQRNRQGWPTTWNWSISDRASFIKAVTRFTSNYAPYFGTLLTPLVSGIRVAGPFTPKWLGGAHPKLVIVDGEGLGHTPSSAAALSTAVSDRLDQVDAVLLVDNAAQPMQAAPVAAMKAVVSSGNSSKLLFAFTHFDLVKGANLPTFADRVEHVKASAENVLKAIGEDLGHTAERALRQRLENTCFYLGGIDAELDHSKKVDRRTIEQLTALLAAVDCITDRAEATEARPVYDRINLVLAVQEAARSYHDSWRGRLGIDYVPGAPKEHWTRIKALTRRLAEGWSNEYDTLKPVAELKRELDEQIYRMIQSPLRWSGHEPTDDEKQRVFDEFANAVSREVTMLAVRRVEAERNRAWREAFAQSGTGSTFVRARILVDDVYDRAAPIPTVTPSPDQNQFLHEVAAIVDRVTADLNIEFM